MRPTTFRHDQTKSRRVPAFARDTSSLTLTTVGAGSHLLRRGVRRTCAFPVRRAALQTVDQLLHFALQTARFGPSLPHERVLGRLDVDLRIIVDDPHAAL